MSKKNFIIASILLLIILTIGIGIGIARANTLALGQLDPSATGLQSTSELCGLPVRGSTLLLNHDLKDLVSAEHTVLQLDVQNLL